MKKLLAVLLVATLVFSLCSAFVSAAATEQNIAINKSYTVNGLYPNNAEPTYPDTDSKELTDGLLADTGAFTEGCWVGFNKSGAEIVNMEVPVGTIDVDLGEEFDATKLVIEVADDTSVGIGAPAGVVFYVSNDKETWTKIGDAVKGEPEHDGLTCLYTLDDVSATGRYFRCEIAFGSNWAFVSEFEIYALAEESEVTPPTGDGVVIFAVIALLSMGGAFVATKIKR